MPAFERSKVLLLAIQCALQLGALQITSAQLTPGQLGTPFGDSSSCDLDTLADRMAELETACGGPTCDIVCAGKFLPIMDDCHDVVMRLYDGADGSYDGEATILTGVYNDCLAMPATDLISELMTLHDEGQCPNTVLDGLAETAVKTPGCADSAAWSGGRCAMSIGSGVLSCERDFCNTVPTRDVPCMMAGQCDEACGLCSHSSDSGDGEHRRLLAMLRDLVADHRSLQMAHVVCDPATFSEQAHDVDDACCDVDTGASTCTDGAPTACDAKCAVVFNSFYDRCHRFLAAQMSLAQMSAYDQLYATCSGALPSEPLLRAGNCMWHEGCRPMLSCQLWRTRQLPIRSLPLRFRVLWRCLRGLRSLRWR